MLSNRPKIAILILNWNNAPDTLECLASVYALRYPNFSVYLIDNGSTDNSLETIRSSFPQATYIQNGCNLGFAEGNNRGMTFALQEGADYLFLLNNDAILHPEVLDLLEKAAQAHPQAGVLGPKIYFYDEPSTLWYGGGEWHPQAATFYHRNSNRPDSEILQREIESTGYVCGCAFFVRATTLRSTGLLDPRFFLNWEEMDLCWRMKQKGYLCLYVPQAKAWHKVSRSFIGGKKGPMWLYYYWRGRLLWMEKNIPLSQRLPLYCKVLLPQFLNLIPQALQGERKARASLMGIRDYLFRRFGPGPTSLLAQ